MALRVGEGAVTQERLSAELASVGVRPGGILLVHSSLSALGWVPGGAETVIRALERAVGPEGTLVMPSLTYERVTRAVPVFDVRETPGNVGAIPERFRVRGGAERSVHPTHSACAAGPRAGELVAGHELDDTPVGPRSPFRRVRDAGGQILFLGCDLTPNTSLHGVEELAAPPYLFGEPVDFHIIGAGGVRSTHRHRPHGFAGVEQRYERLAPLLAPRRAIRTGPALEGSATLVEAAPMWDAALAVLREDPWHFVDRIAA